jgi:dienelactone hydrolase
MQISKQKISFLSEGQKIRGTLIKPKKIVSKIPGVIFFHGMTSSEKGYIPIAEKLAQHGICAMALSIRGHGNSEGNFNKLKVPNAIKDGINAYDFLASHNFIDTKKIGLCGSSVGAVIICMVSKQRKVKSLVLKAPAIYTKKMMTMTYDQTMLREDKMFKEIKDVTNTPAIKATSRFKGSLLAILSEKDNIIPPKMQEQYLFNADKVIEKKKIIIKGASHSLEKEKWRKVFISEMIKWFVKTL